MSLDRIQLSTITEEDLRTLVDNGVAEGLTLDYKRKAVDKTGEAKRDFLKDVSAFANARGGDIVFGIEAKDGIPLELCGLSEINFDQEVLRLSSLMADGIRPSIFGLDILLVPLQGKGPVIIVRVPRSWSDPHMVVFQNHNRFYIRRANGNDMMTVDEIREEFLRGQETAERIRSLHHQRLDVIAHRPEELPLGLSSMGRLAVHLIPFEAMSAGFYVDIRQVHPSRDFWMPLLTGGGSAWRYNADGLLLYQGMQDENPKAAYVQVHRNGMIEAVCSGITRKDPSGHTLLSGGSLDPKLALALPRYLAAQRERLKVQPPIAIFLALTNCQGAEIDMGPRFIRPPNFTPIDRHVVSPSEVVIYAYDDEVMTVLKPVLDAIWNSSDWEGSPFFDEHGEFRQER